MRAAEKSITEQLIELIKKLDYNEQEMLLAELTDRLHTERRESPRKHFLTMVTYASHDKAFNDFTRDISQGGVFIETHMPFSIGQNISMTFPVPNMQKHIKLTGEIARLAENGIGVQFHLSNKEQEELVKTLMETITGHPHPEQD